MATTLRDIVDDSDIRSLMSTFYNTLLEDKEMDHLFSLFIPGDFEKHLDRICLFWKKILFGNVEYKTNVMNVHINIHRQYPLESHHFELWLITFVTTVDSNFQGPNAEQIKMSATSIAKIMEMKINNQGLITVKKKDL